MSPDGSTVFVTGGTGRTSQSAFHSHATTIAYNASTGARRWLTTYYGLGRAGGTSVAVSPDGATVYVTGDTATQPIAPSAEDYFTVAYNASTGAKLWLRRYDSPPNGFNRAVSVVVSPDGATVFVTGTGSRPGSVTNKFATVAYRAATGATAWVARYSGLPNADNDVASMAVSPDGASVFLTGSTEVTPDDWEYTTVAYHTTTGTRLWAAHYNALRAGPAAASVAVSPDGATVFVTGTSAAKGSLDYGTVAYNAATGAAVWTRRYTGIVPESVNEATSVAVSPDGSQVFVTGFSSGTATNEVELDWATVAYAAATGARLWASRYAGPGDYNLTSALGVSPDGSEVFVTGYGLTTPGGSTTDYETAAFRASTGGRLWAASYTGGGDTNKAASLAVSPDGPAVFVTGLSANPNNHADYATIAYGTAATRPAAARAP